MKIIGLMSGTSLDGLDMLYCDISADDEGDLSYEMLRSECVEYSQEWITKLSSALLMDEMQLAELHEEYGQYIGCYVSNFIKKNELKPSLISSHGHTIFHQPDQGITLQIGDGQIIADLTGVTTIFDFRNQDVQMGGQGAPLVPIGDKLLFEEYSYCLNLGGFANISYETDGQRFAFDVGPCNLLLNHYCRKLGLKYDDRGRIARSGKLIKEIFNRWNKLDYYKKDPPKSLGIEWIKSTFWKNNYEEHHINDLLHTTVEHIAFQIGQTTQSEGQILITGGGAFNAYLIERIDYYSNAEIVISDDELINNKEALIFALLGYLRFNNQTNILSSVTGAIQDHCSGTIAYCTFQKT